MGALVGCSNDDDGTAKVTPDMTTAYANINIVMPNHAGTRAFTPDDGTQTNPPYSNKGENFEYGTAAENAIKSMLLIFYDAQGNVVGNSTEIELANKQHPGASVATMYKNSVKITLIEGANMPASVMAYINPANTDSQNDRLDRIKTLYRDVYKNAEGGFLMNNSGYYEGGNYKLASDINSDCIFASKDDADEATANQTITIYVERVAAKVKLAFDTAKQGAINNVDVYDNQGNQNYELTFAPENWAVTAIAKRTMLLKDLNPTTAQLVTSIPDYASWVLGPNRTYWARSYGYGADTPVDADATKFPVVGTDNNDAQYLLQYVTNSEANGEYKNITATLTDDNVFYIMENTMRGSRLTTADYLNPYACVTSAIVKGHYTVTGPDAAKFNDGFYIRSYSKVNDDKTEIVNAIYTEDELITAMLAGQNIIKLADATGDIKTKIGLGHYDEVKDATGDKNIKNPANRVALQVTDKTGLLFNNNGTWVDVTDDNISDVNEKLFIYAGQAKHYNKREAFFYIPIKHNNATGTDNKIPEKNVPTGNYGIVRNHSYQITINSIGGLAIGVHADEKLLPDPNSVKDYYVNATMNVLAWHVMGQKVDL